MRLLVSVAEPGEARAALAGGADVIDAKDPARGALGPVPLDRLAAICRLVEGRGTRPVSAALGDASQATAVAGARAASLGVRFIKVGFGGVPDEARACRLGRATRRALAAALDRGSLVDLVLVAYADWRRAESLEPMRVIAMAGQVGAAGVLLDTARKDAPLFAIASPDAVAAWVAAAHGAGLFAALAGSLSGRDLLTAATAGADLVGVRGAACVGGRTGRVSRARVARLASLARSPRLRVGALA